MPVNVTIINAAICGSVPPTQVADQAALQAAIDAHTSGSLSLRLTGNVSNWSQIVISHPNIDINLGSSQGVTIGVNGSLGTGVVSNMFLIASSN